MEEDQLLSVLGGTVGDKVKEQYGKVITNPSMMTQLEKQVAALVLNVTLSTFI